MILQRNGSDQGQTTRHQRQAELSANADDCLPDGLKQRRQQDAHHRSVDAQQGSAHWSQSAQVTPEGQEPANQEKRGKKESDERPYRTGDALKIMLRLGTGPQSSPNN